MTLDDVKKIRADMRPGHHILTDDVVEAIDWLADALREAQAAVVQMRKDAALTVEDCLRTGLLTPGNMKTAAAQVRRLPLPAPAVAPVAAPKPAAFDAEAFAKALHPIAGEDAYDLCVRIRAAALAAEAFISQLANDRGGFFKRKANLLGDWRGIAKRLPELANIKGAFVSSGREHISDAPSFLCGKPKLG